MIKVIQLDIPTERHLLTKQLKLNMIDMRNATSILDVEFYKGRMLGLTAAYFYIGIIDALARCRYIDLIIDAGNKRLKEIEK